MLARGREGGGEEGRGREREGEGGREGGWEEGATEFKAITGTLPTREA